jgi:predicted RNase H-like HicB family nuclease
MLTIKMFVHCDGQGEWWAETDDLPDGPFTAAAGSLEELRETYQEAIGWIMETDPNPYTIQEQGS